VEIKHIVPYLPYELKVIHEEAPTPLTVYGISIYDNKMVNIAGNSTLSIERCKPLLLPISELGRQAPKTVVGRRLVDEINKNCMYSLDRYGDFYDLPEAMSVDDVWETYEGLFKYHFDVFGLIDQGLALNKLDYEQT